MITSWIKSIIRTLGYDSVRRTDDPVLRDLLDVYRDLRLAPDNPVLWEDRLAQPASFSHLRNLLRSKPIDLVIDVGANVGQFASRVRRLGYVGTIVSFEPARSTRAVLESAAAGDPRWIIRPEALGRARGKGNLEIYADSTFSSLNVINDLGRERFGGLVDAVGREVVEIAPLDMLLGEIAPGGPRCILLKTDTQGHDREVLAGAAATLKDTVVVLSEASTTPIYDKAAGLSELMRDMEREGFTLSGIFPTGHGKPPNMALLELDCFFVRKSTLTV